MKIKIDLRGRFTIKSYFDIYLSYKFIKVEIKVKCILIEKDVLWLFFKFIFMINKWCHIYHDA